jgi:hypothetical protein
MRLGLDFDNTLISYDTLFRQVALDKGLVPQETAPQKNAVRDYLRQQDREDEWTKLQGEVYGGRILEAAPYPGMRDTLARIATHGVPMVIVSHKTRYPYLGERWDLHAAARSWLEKHGFHAEDGLNWQQEQVFFELSKEEKIARIVAQQCTHYVDDLPEILDMLPDTVNKILFSPDGNVTPKAGWTVMSDWQQLPGLLKLA